MALILSLEVLHTALVINMIPLHSLLQLMAGPDKYDLNHANALPLMTAKFSSLFKRLLWLIVSNAALRSREIQPRSDDRSRSFVTLMRAVSVL